MNKINHTIFSSGYFSLALSIRLTDQTKKNYSNTFVMQSGYRIITYSPRKGFIIKDNKSKEEVAFTLSDIYDLKDTLKYIYNGMIKEDMFFYDALKVLTPDIELIKKYTFELKNHFNGVKIMPDIKQIEFEDIEGISFIFKNKESVFLDHTKVQRLVKILSATDFLTLSETLITNALLGIITKTV